MEDKLLILHKNLIKDGYDMPDYDTFKSDMADPNNSLALHKNLIKDGYDMPEYDTFIGDMGLKKKEFSLESFAKSENVFQTLGLSSKESSTPKLPLQSSKKPEPVSYEDTLVEDFSISAFIKAQNKYSQYLKQEQEKIISEKQEEINDAINALQDNYKSKIEANPEQTKKLQAEYEKEAQKVVELRAGTLPSQIERLVKEKDYQYLGKGDIKEIEKTISDILQQPTTHEDKINSIEDFKRNFMYKLSSMPEEYKDPVKKELEDVVARKSLVNEMGMPTILGWKQEVKSKKQKLENAIQQEISDYKDKYPQLKEATNQFGGIDMRLAQEYLPEKEFTRLTNLIDMQGKANKFFNKTLELPNDAGSFWEGFKSEGEAIKTAGLVDLFDALDLSSVISKQKKGGTLTPAEQALIDAHGILQVAESSEELGKAYTRGKNIGGSVVWMEQFILTSGIGKAASGTAIKVLGSSVKNKVVQNITKGIGSAVGRTPVLVGGYTEAIQRASGSPELSKQGVWEVDPAKAESVWKAIGKGAYQNFSEAFFEEAGGFLKGTKVGSAIGRRLGLTRLPKVVIDFARVTAFQPLGELPEEYLTSLAQTPVMGDQTLKEAFSWENVWETAVQVGIVSGALGSAGLPSVISHNQKRARNKELIDIFGRDNISTLRDAILDGDVFAFEHAMTMALEGKGYKELKGLSLEKAQKRLTGYVTTLAQERGARVAQEEITSVANTGEPTIEVEEEEEAAPTFKINNKEFTTKEELFTYLEENATVEDGTRVKEGWMETKEIPDQATLSAINEWEATKKTTVESKYTEATEEEKERMKRPELTEEKRESDESDKKDKESVAASKLQDAELRGEDIEGMDREESQDDTETGDRTTGDAAIAVQETEEFTEREHKANIEQQFRDEFGKKGVPEEQINGALALLEARANAWASEEKGRTTDQYYQKIAGVKGGEFAEGVTPKLYQLPDGREVMGVNMPEVVNGFYSPIEKRLAEFKQEKVSVNKWKEIVGKGDEATFTGVLDWLNSLKPDQSLTKTEINQFMKDNRIEVVEVVKSDELPRKQFASQEEINKKKDRLNWIRANGSAIGRKYGFNSKEYNDLTNEEGEIFNWLKNNAPGWGMAEGSSISPTKFSQWQLPGEKENYKEVLVTMPAKELTLEEKFQRIGYTIEQTDYGAWRVVDDMGIPIHEKDTREELLSTFPERRVPIVSSADKNFTRSHWDEPNVLVHLRMNTRTDADGKKVLFIEEVQSDWGQIGKKEGFAKFNQERFNELEKILQDNPELNKFGTPERNEYNFLLSVKNAKGIPTAPFVTDTNAWTKLGLKTALREAINQGVDRIAWTTGEQQNERYDLSKQVDWIDYQKNPNGTYSFSTPVEITKPAELSEKELADYVGKEIAQRMIDGEGEETFDGTWKRLQGDQLKVGGKGMIGFYGSPQESKLGIVGNIAKKLFKQEPKTSKIQTGTDAIKDLGWHKDYEKGDYVLEYELKGGFKGRGRFDTKEEVKKYEDELRAKYANEQHSIDITPELKQEVEKGLPLFQKEGKKKAKGAVETLDDGRVVIHAMESPDFSTMVHEITHVFEKDLTAEEISVVEKWSGKKQGTKGFSEDFARAGERYLRDGKAPNEQLKPIFEKFKQWLTSIYKKLKGSPIEKKLSPEVRQIFDRLLTTETKEKVPEKPTEKPGKGEKYRKTQINALIQDETLQQKEVAKIVDANKERYEVLHRAEAVEEAKKLIDEQGVRNATDEFTQKTRRLDDLPTRQVARLVLLEFYSRAIIDPNASARDKTEAFNAMDKLQAIIAREATVAGKSSSMLYAWRSMQPSGLLAYVERKIAKSNDKTLNKKVGKATIGEQLDSLFETLTEDSKKIISDILSGKEITIPQTTKATAKDIPKRKTVPRERIKREQEFRKNLIAEYKAKHGGGITLRAGVPLDVEQIEFGGALLASYVKEGIYRIQDAIDQLTKELREAGIDPTEERIDQLLNLNKSADETFREYIERIESKARMRAGEKLISKRISDVITEHWTEHDELRRTLAQKLMDEAGLTEAEANRLEKQVLEKFDKEILKRSQDKLAKLLGTKRIPVEKTNKGIVGDMVKLINLGALNEQLYRELFAEKFKLVKLTEQHKEEILRLASNVQLASGKGFIERDATIRLAKYIYELYPESQQGAIFETWISLAYANMLFGPSTSILNMWSAGSNLTSKPIREITNLSKWLRVIKDAKKGEADIYNPFGDMFYIPMLLGSKAGIDYAHEVYRNGDLDNKYIEDIAKKDRFKVQQLERDKYGKAKRYKPVTVKIKGKEYDLNIFNKYKYSGRNLSAQDKLMLFTSYEVEIAHILRDKLKNKDLRGRALTREVMSILRGERMDMEQIEKTLQEDAALYKQMNNEEMTDLQKNIHRRELMLDQMPLTPEERQEAEQLARSNIFTDDRYGAIASIARAIGMASNSNPLAGLVVKPFIPFTKVVGNVSEYMLDHAPFYGFLRANGWSVTGIYARMRGDEARSAQMGERGSRAYYEQMGRAWLGTLSFLLFGMMFLGKDEDDFLELSGGYTKEGWKKRGRENVLPPYTIRIGKVKIPYKNIPGLAIPLALIGNVNDGLKLKQDEGSLMERLTLSLLLDASRNTVLMFKDMSFLEGAQNLVTMIGDALSTEESRWESVGESALKSYLGFLARPLPQNNNAIQQIWKIFDPESMPQKDVSAMLRYAGGVQHFGKYPSVDQLGDHIKTFPGETVLPWTHWVGLKGSDDRWAFLAKYNAIPNRLYNRTMPIETKDGIERRHMEEDELYHYCRRTGTLFSNYIEEYRSDIDKVKKRASDIIEREKSNGEIEKVNGVRFDMEGLWSRAKDNAETELFRWGTVKETMPETWNLITKHEAYQHYQSQKQTDGYKYTKSELYEFNNHATVFYAQRVKSYLQSNMPAIDKKRIVDGESKFQITIDDMWDKARDDAERIMKRHIGKNTKEEK